MKDHDIVVVGGGLTGIILVKVLNNLGYKPLILDPDFVLGGIARGDLVGDYVVEAFPLFLTDNDVSLLEEIGFELDVVEVYLEPRIIKHGPLKAKIWGYRRRRIEDVEDLENPWPLRWRGKLLYPRLGWTKTISSWQNRLDYKWIHDGVKRIDVEGRRIKTYHGQVLGYRVVYYTLPLAELRAKIGLEVSIPSLRYCHMVSLSVLTGKGVDWAIGYHGGTAILPHTIVNIHVILGEKDYANTIALISYDGEELPAGFVEQTISRLKKMNIVLGNIFAERIYNAKYACINSSDLRREYRIRLYEEFLSKGLVLVGRRALWLEMGLGDIVKDVVDKVTSSL